MCIMSLYEDCGTLAFAWCLHVCCYCINKKTDTMCLYEMHVLFDLAELHARAPACKRAICV